MIKRILLFLVLSIPGWAIAQQKGDRMLGLTTQDQNGLHFVFVVATPSKVRASVRQFSSDHTGVEEVSDYPRALFDELWFTSKELGLSAFSAGQMSDIGASKNYVLTIGTGDAIEQAMYLVPKCSAGPAIESFVKRLTRDLLPAGSPGLFEPCPRGYRNEG